jgi:hypothetical protein
MHWQGEKFWGDEKFWGKKKKNPKSLIFYTHERRLTLAKKPEATANLSHFPQTLPSLGGISPSSTSHQPKFFLLSAKIPPSSKHTRQPLTWHCSPKPFPAPSPSPQPKNQRLKPPFPPLTFDHDPSSLCSLNRQISPSNGDPPCTRKPRETVPKLSIFPAKGEKPTGHKPSPVLPLEPPPPIVLDLFFSRDQPATHFFPWLC